MTHFLEERDAVTKADAALRHRSAAASPHCGSEPCRISAPLYLGTAAPS